MNKRRTLKWLKIQLSQLKPIYHTMVFEFFLQKLKFIVFGVISIVLPLVVFYFPYESDPNLIPENQADSLNYDLLVLGYLILFITVTFFSGIICSDYKRKTGFLTFPLTKKSYILIGKFLANFLIILVIISIFYITLAVILIHFYGYLLYTFYYSYNFAILYSLALASFTTLFSSFLPSVSSVVISVMLIFLVGFNLIQLLFDLYEPLWALPYLFNIVMFIPYPDFATRERVFTWTDGVTVHRHYNFPTIEGAIVSMLMYFIFSIILAHFIFARREKISFVRFRRIKEKVLKKTLRKTL